MGPLVTISIPVFQCEHFLKKCLKSVLQQTYSNIEVTLINDQTPDRSVEIAEQFIEDHQLENTWSLFHLEENGGLSVVRNKGIDTAKGKYLFFLDSDDEIQPFCIEEMVKIAEEHHVEMVVGEVEGVILETGERINVFPLNVREKVLKGNEIIFENFVNGNYPESSWNKLYLLEFVKKNQLYFTPGLFAQDSLQSFQTALKLSSSGFLFMKTYVYYLHENSVIHNRSERHFNNWITIAKAINTAYLEEKNAVIKWFILIYLLHFKDNTLIMNWKAQKNEQLWKKSYEEYSKLKSLGWKDFFSHQVPQSLKKQHLFNSLPVNLGFKVFKWRYNR